MKRSLSKVPFIYSLLAISLLVLAGCSAQLVTPVPANNAAEAPTEPTEEPTQEAAGEGASGERTYGAVELTTNPWLWVSFTDPVEQFELEMPEQYTISFTKDGSVAIKADCNNATGTYIADDNGSLTIELGAMTLAACPPDSRSDEFVQTLGFVTGYFFENGYLYLDTMADSGTFQLASADESMTTERVPVGDELSVDALTNGTYSGIYPEGPVTLTAGLYQGEAEAGGSARPTVDYVEGSELYGDLDGDGVADAAVLLVESSGGSGVFTYIAAQLNQGGEAIDGGAIWVGDRTQVKSAAIVDGQIVLEIITQGPGEPLCCGSLKVRKSYALQEGLLAEVGSEELGQISADDLNGTSWTLVDLNFDQQPALVDAPVTLTFADGQLSGSSGCNRYNSRFTLDAVNLSAMSIAPVASTKMACAEPILTQETTYLTALQNVMQWGYVAGKLALSYEIDGNFGTLIFAPTAP